MLSLWLHFINRTLVNNILSTSSIVSESAVSILSTRSKKITLTAPFNSKPKRFLLPSIKCGSAAPLSFRLCCLNWAQQFYLITAHLAEVGSWKEPLNIWLRVVKNAFVGWDLNFTFRMLLKSAVMSILHVINFGEFWA